VIEEMEWVLKSIFELRRDEIATIIQTLANNQRFRFENWSVLQCALMDYRDYSKVDLSDCLIARKAKDQGAAILYTFESGKNWLLCRLRLH
jgi:predicted nucleic-acid-binding protein